MTFNDFRQSHKIDVFKFHSVIDYKVKVPDCPPLVIPETGTGWPAFCLVVLHERG